MSTDALIKPISDQHPCGEDLSYDGQFQVLESEMAKQLDELVSVELEPKKILPDIESLSNKTKDLRLALWWARALMEKGTLTEVADKIALAHQWLDDYWETLYPQPDKDDDEDPYWARRNEINNINSHLFFKKPLGNMSLVRGVLLADLTDKDKKAAAKLHLQSASPEIVTECLGALTKIEEALKGVLKNFQAHTTHELTPTLGDLRGFVQASIKELVLCSNGRETTLNEESESNNASHAEEIPSQTNPQPTRSSPVVNQIQSREDIAKCLDEICEYFQKHEPSSPIPLLLTRAKGLLNKNFTEVIEALLPKAMDEVKRMGGGDGKGK